MAWPLLAALGAILGPSIIQSGENLFTNGANMVYNDIATMKQRAFESNEAYRERQWQSFENDLNRNWQTEANRIAMDFNAEQYEKQRDFDLYLASNAHQLEVEDLRKAGLNPILSAGGNGASVNQGGFAQGVANGFSTSGAGATARSNAQSVNLKRSNAFDHISSMVGDFLSEARQVSHEAMKFEYEMDKLDRRYENDKDYFDYVTKQGKYRGRR